MMPMFATTTIHAIHRLLTERIYFLSFFLFAILFSIIVKFNVPLPFVDTIAFANLNLLPSNESFGEYYYYVFQFTYILGHVLLRLLGHLHLDAIAASNLCYLILIAILWAATGQITKLMNLPAQARVFSILLIVAGWIPQGLNIWGGPFFFTLGECIAFLLFAILLSNEDTPSRSIAPPVVTAVLALAAHPFALPFIIMVITATTIFRWSRQQMYRAAATLLVTILYTLLIVVDRSLGAPPTSVLGAIIDVRLLSSLHLIYERWLDVFRWHYAVDVGLLGQKVESLYLASQILAYVVTIGAVGALFLFLVRFKTLLPTERSVCFLAVGTFIYYLICPADPISISMWPYRSFVFTALPCTLSFVLLITRCVAALDRYFANTFVCRHAWLLQGSGWIAVLPAFVVPFIVLHDLREIGKAYPLESQKLIRDISRSAVRGCVLYFTDIKNISPFWLHSVPFSVFLDPEFEKRDVIIVTEWHQYSPQQNAKIPMHLAERFLGRICTVKFEPTALGHLAYEISSEIVK